MRTVPTPIDVLAKALPVGFRLGDPSELVAAWGGKAVGLAVLMRAGRTTPATWLLSTAQVRAGLAAAARPSLVLPPGTAGWRWAVRSSAPVEDGAEASHAGQFTSIIDVHFAEVADAVGRVGRSGTADRVRAYRRHLGLDTGTVELAVVLQRYLPPAFAGVWVGHPDGDLEWAVVSGRLLWLQARPVTRSLVPGGRSGSAAGQATDGTLLGVAASSGHATGRAAVLEDHHDPRWTPGAVLVVRDTDPDWVPVMVEASALITERGGMLSHAAIIARELGLPAVTGVTGACTRIRPGQVVLVDGDRGMVRGTA
jgi:pyruvate,water dikinase